MVNVVKVPTADEPSVNSALKHKKPSKGNSLKSRYSSQKKPKGSKAGKPGKSAQETFDAKIKKEIQAVLDLDKKVELKLKPREMDESSKSIATPKKGTVKTRHKGKAHTNKGNKEVSKEFSFKGSKSHPEETILTNTTQGFFYDPKPTHSDVSKSKESAKLKEKAKQELIAKIKEEKALKEKVRNIFQNLALKEVLFTSVSTSDTPDSTLKEFLSRQKKITYKDTLKSLGLDDSQMEEAKAKFLEDFKLRVFNTMKEKEESSKPPLPKDEEANKKKSSEGFKKGRGRIKKAESKKPDEGIKKQAEIPKKLDEIIRTYKKSNNAPKLDEKESTSSTAPTTPKKVVFKEEKPKTKKGILTAKIPESKTSTDVDLAGVPLPEQNPNPIAEIIKEILEKPKAKVQKRKEKVVPLEQASVSDTAAKSIKLFKKIQFVESSQSKKESNLQSPAQKVRRNWTRKAVKPSSSQA